MRKHDPWGKNFIDYFIDPARKICNDKVFYQNKNSEEMLHDTENRLEMGGLPDTHTTTELSSKNNPTAVDVSACLPIQRLTLKFPLLARMNFPKTTTVFTCEVESKKDACIASPSVIFIPEMHRTPNDRSGCLSH